VTWYNVSMVQCPQFSLLNIFDELCTHVNSSVG